MSPQNQLQAFIQTLPEVETARLPVGTLFTTQGRIYQVIEARPGGFHKARQWRSHEDTDVVLVAGSFLTNFLPLVTRGHLLPIYPTRDHLLERGEVMTYLFPEEKQALDAAYLDTALVKSGDVYVRNHGRKPGFAITDGARLFRTYFYSRAVHNTTVDEDITTATTIQFRPCTRGPLYWRLLPTWQDIWPSGEDTLPMQPIQ
jgi:hypothetical protein